MFCTFFVCFSLAALALNRNGSMCRRIALSMYTALLTAAFGVDKKMLPENPLKHEMKLLKFEHNKLKNTQVDDKTYYNIIHLKT